MYRVEVSKLVGTSWFLVPENALGVWDVVVIGPSFRVPESRINLRGSMQLVGQCVKFYRK